MGSPTDEEPCPEQRYTVNPTPATQVGTQRGLLMLDELDL
jgi:hypothetical protein